MDRERASERERKMQLKPQKIFLTDELKIVVQSRVFSTSEWHQKIYGEIERDREVTISAR